MNRVQTVTQKHYRVEKPDKKPSRLYEPPTGPTGQACAHRPRPGRARAWLCRGRSGRVVAGPPGSVAGQHGRIAASLPRPSAQRQHLLAPGACCAPSAVSWAQCRGRQRRVVAVRARRHGRIVVCLATHCPASNSPSRRNTLYCIVMQFQPN